MGMRPPPSYRLKKCWEHAGSAFISCPSASPAFSCGLGCPPSHYYSTFWKVGSFLKKCFLFYKGPIHTRAKSRDQAQKNVSKGRRPNTPPKSCSVVTGPQAKWEIICTGSSTKCYCISNGVVEGMLKLTTQGMLNVQDHQSFI